MRFGSLIRLFLVILALVLLSQLTIGAQVCPPHGTYTELSACEDNCNGICDMEVCNYWSENVPFYWCSENGHCGDGTCDIGETATTCPSDCTTTSYCGDGNCESPETTSSCPADCDGGCGTSCTFGERRCSGDGYQLCIYDTSWCTVWSNVFNCPTTYTCEGGVCIPDDNAVCGNGVCESPEENYINCPEDCDCPDCGCDDECSYSGQRACADEEQYKICGNYDVDSCLEWGTPFNCPPNTQCTNGQCVPDGPVCGNGICEWPPENWYNCPQDCDCVDCTCDDECSLGQRRCTSDSAFEICGNFDTDSCTEWGSDIYCPSNMNCINGQCIYEPDCTIQQFTAANGLNCQSPRLTWQTYNCDNVAIYLDRSYNPSDYPGLNCPTRFLYAEGQGGVENLDFMRDGYGAGELHSCTSGNDDSITAARFILEADGETRNIVARYSGTCGGTSCEDECVLGTRECYEDGFRICGNFDTDACTEWGQETACPPTQSCLNGYCIPGPSPQSPVWTPIPNQYIRCDETFSSINLANFIYDPDTPIENLTFIVSGGLNVIPYLNTTTNIVTFTMVPDTDFVEVITFIARDPEGNTATIRVTFIRQGCNIIDPPEPPTYQTGPRILSIPSQTVMCGDDFQSFDLDNFAYDPDGDNLSFVVYGGVYIQPSLDDNGVVSFDYDDDDLTIDIMEQLTFRVMDQDGRFAEYTAQFKVVNCEDSVIVVDPAIPDVCQAKKYVQNSQYAVYLDDQDCDNIPDVDDNCMMIPNFDQADYNGNGIGDKCDLAITRFELEPSKIDSGRTAVAYVELSNLMIHDVENVRLTLDIDELDMKSIEYVDFLGQERQKTVQFLIPTNNCIRPGQYEAELTVRYLGRDTTVKKAMLTILSDKYCAGPVMLNSDIHVYELQDIKRQEAGTYPIEITNENPIAKQYVLSVEGTSWLGEHAFVPSNVLVLQPGEQERVDLTLTPYADTALGEQNFMLHIQSGDEKVQQLMVANIEENEWSQDTSIWESLLGYLLAAIIIALMIVAAIVLSKQIKNDKKKHPERRGEPLLRENIEEIRKLDEFLDQYDVKEIEKEERELKKGSKKRKDMFKEFDE